MNDEISGPYLFKKICLYYVCINVDTKRNRNQRFVHASRYKLSLNIEISLKFLKNDRLRFIATRYSTSKVDYFCNSYIVTLLKLFTWRRINVCFYILQPKHTQNAKNHKRNKNLNLMFISWF